MGYMAKKLFLTILFTLLSTSLYAAELKSTIKDNKAEFVFTFQKGYSAFEQLADETKNTLVFTFDTTEKIVFDRENYYDIPIKSAYLDSKDKKRFFVEFKEQPIEPIINKTNKKISIVFPIPVKTNTNVLDNNQQVASPKIEPVGAGSYGRMLFGLTIVLIIIMVLFYFLKVFFKRQIYSDIPGSGRLLGKVDLELRKSLYFYEIGDIIYIIGVTDSGMNVIDKIVDEVEAVKIRAGFIKKHDFKGYMTFFKRKEHLDEELSSSNAIVEDKLNSIRNRKGNVE